MRTFALPQWQWSDWGPKVTQNAYFLLITHTKQLLLVTFCYTTAEIGASFRTHGRRTDGRTDGRRTDGRTEDGRTDGGRTEGQTDVEVEIVI